MLPWDSADYTLDWPHELLTAELYALVLRPYRGWSGAEVQLLLREAFHEPQPAADFARINVTLRSPADRFDAVIGGSSNECARAPARAGDGACSRSTARPCAAPGAPISPAGTYSG